MLEVYAAWTEGAKEADIEAIRQAMQSSSQLPARFGTPTALAKLRAISKITALSLSEARSF